MSRKCATGDERPPPMRPRPIGGGQLPEPRALRIGCVVISREMAGHRRVRYWRHHTQNSRAGARLPVIAAMWVALCAAPASAQSPPNGCRAASKIEYDSAKRTYLLQN